MRARAHTTSGASTITTALLAAAFLTIVSASGFAQSPPPAPEKKWSPSIDFEGKLGTQRNLGEADVMLPLWQNTTSMLFASVRTRLDDNDGREGNFGAGFRHMTEWGWNLGAYSYFDRRRSENFNYYNQVTVGAEALSLDWDGRFNAYIPEGRRTHQVDSFNTAEVSGTTVLLHDGEEKSLRGFDAEVGWRVPLFNPEALQQLRLYAGGYTFYADNIDNRVQGPRGRIEFTSEETPYLWEGSRLTLGTEVQNDGPRGTQAFFLARLRIPLQFWDTPKVAQLTPMERRMTDRIVRDVDIVSQAGNFGAVETATATAGGSAITVVNSSTTSGANLQNALNTAGANSTVIVSGSFNTAGAITTLQAGQTVMGAGSVVVQAPSGRTATLTTQAATLTGNVGTSNYTVVMANNSTLMGMTVNNTDTAGNNALGVKVNGVSNAKIINNTINATETGGGASTAHGIDVIGAASNVTISGNTVTAQSNGGIALAIQVNDPSHPSATISGNTLSASGAGTTNATVDLSQANILSGSSGNIAVAGTCHVSAAGTGSTVQFTNAAACGP